MAGTQVYDFVDDDTRMTVNSLDDRPGQVAVRVTAHTSIIGPRNVIVRELDRVADALGIDVEPVALDEPQGCCARWFGDDLALASKLLDTLNFHGPLENGRVDVRFLDDGGDVAGRVAWDDEEGTYVLTPGLAT